MRLRTFTAALLLACSGTLSAQEPQPFEPTVGQAGKDVVWVPTSPELVERMLNLAAVTANDYVMDLGSGDGRNIIAAAKRGARGRGVEFNPDMVALSKRRAEEAGVADKAEFVEGDMYIADISRANVLALFLLPHNLDKLVDKFLALEPGSRIVVNTFGITGWTPDKVEKLETNCSSWCTAMLYIVPARVEGTWRAGNSALELKQEFQQVTGTLTMNGKPMAIEQGKLDGRTVTFVVGGATYTGQVDGSRIQGTIRRGSTQTPWTATKP